MKVLVTGAAGFLGRHLTSVLLARGDAVVALDIAFNPPVEGGVEPVLGSVLDPAAADRALEGCDAVIHGAALTGLWHPKPAAYEEVNVGGTRIVLDAAERAGISRVVVVSSFVTLISGPRRQPDFVDERLELPVGAMLGAYPRSKRRAELLCRSHPVDPVIVMPSAPIGPGDHGLTPPSQMVLDLATGSLPALLDCTWNFIDVRALAAGVVAALDNGRPGRRYLLAGENMQTADLVKILTPMINGRMPRFRVPHGIALAAGHVEAGLSALTGSPPKGPLTGIRLAGPRLRFDTTRAQSELGFAPGPAAPAFEAALDWMKSQRLI